MITLTCRLLAVGLSAMVVGLGPLCAAESTGNIPSEVALQFINDHVSSPLGYEETIARVEASPLVTEHYKKALTKLYRDALKKEPEYGYGADAVIGGQESPERFRVKSSKIEGDRARVLLIGEDADFPMEVKVELVCEDGRWLVDASGDLVQD
jgi:hypothetical protein